MESIPDTTTGILLHSAELSMFGCRNCVWKQYRQCPNGLTKKDSVFSFIDDNVNVTGYCMAYIKFILSMGSSGDSVSSIWEKFHLYIAELQSLEDFTSLKELEREIIELEQSSNSEDKRLLHEKHVALKLWWLRLNENVRSGRQKIVDRESKEKIAKNVKVPGIMSGRSVSFDKTKQLEDKK